MSHSRKSRNPFFPLCALFAAAFVLTIFASVAALFGDPRAKPAVFIDEHGGSLIAAEVAAILVSGFLAMAIDRRQALRARKSETEQSKTEQQQTGSQSVEKREGSDREILDREE